MAGIGCITASHLSRPSRAGEMSLGPPAWLEIVGSEYLDDFVREGGAAVKFVIGGSQEIRLEVREGLRDLAGRAGFQFTLVDATATRVHMIDRLFHAVATQVDWDSLAQAFLARLL